MEKQTCFIIMPLSMPDGLLSMYNDDSKHFIHILENLFVPIVDKCGFDVIKPIAEGSEIIHSKIIDNLINADLVVCDISISNPNVFFELGIRTALNKQVCIVKDEKTIKIPFDASIINVLTYDSSLPAWKYDSEKNNMEEHIKSAMAQGGKNALWSVFGAGLTSDVAIDKSTKNKIEMLQLQNELLEEKLQKVEDSSKVEKTSTVFRAKAHKCSHCGYNFIINDSISVFSNSMLSTIAPLYLKTTNIPEENVVRCPKCKNIDIIR